MHVSRHIHRRALPVCLAAALLAGCDNRHVASPLPDFEQARELRAALTGGSSPGQKDQVEQAVVGTGWATLNGTIRLDPGATPRQAKPLPVNRETNICAPGGKVVFDQVMLVDEQTRGIANVAIYLRKPSRVHESMQPNDERKLFDQEHCIFLSHVFPVRIGQTVEVKNSDPTSHNTNVAGKNQFNYLIPQLQSLEFKPALEENFPVRVSCSIHPWMLAYMLPRKDGYFAVTAPDGSFEIAHVPAGEQLEFQVWHENASGAGGGVPGGPQEYQWTAKGRFKVKLQEDAVETLDVVLPASAFKG